MYKRQAPAPVPPLPPPIVPDADSPSLIIWNGCGRMGLGARAERWMRRLGFDVYETTNADRSDYPQTLLITRPGREEPAGEILRSLQERLRVGRLADKEVRLRDVDALLILGRDFPDSLPLR
ncbi:MAG: LytR C-terminal domain-containing protein [Candidatus Eisenbacteria bacterium]|nr:LytR C-terminal domain-containing protein [Candidatus Eisenbacteria bacterium]